MTSLFCWTLCYSCDGSGCRVCRQSGLMREYPLDRIYRAESHGKSYGKSHALDMAQIKAEWYSSMSLLSKPDLKSLVVGA